MPCQTTNLTISTLTNHTFNELIIIISTQNEQIIQKIDGTVQQILKIKGE